MSFLRFLFGLEETETLSGDSRWELSGMPHGPWLLVATVLVLAAVALVVLLYLRERSLGRARGVTLAVLRIAALTLVLLALLNPRIVTEIHNERPGRTLVLLDGTTSMSQRDRHRGAGFAGLERVTGLGADERPTRAALLHAALERQETIERLREKNSVSLFTFGREVKPLGAIGDPRVLFPSDEETRVGDALAAVIRETRADPVTAIVLVTDGRNNAGDHPIDVVSDPVRWRSVPVHAVAIGLVEETRNFSVMELSAPDVVEAGYPVEVEGVVRLSGIRGQVEATLYRLAPKGRGKETVETRTLESAGPAVETRLKFIDTVPEKGTYRYRLEVEAHPDETTRRDNRREVSVLAAEEKRRVLLLSSTATRLYKFVARFFIRDDGIQASCWLADADPQYIQDGDVTIRDLPRSADELKTYDMIALFDPHPDVLSPEFLEALREFVTEQGGGVVYVAGESYAPLVARETRLRRFRALLPVVLDDSAPLLGGGQFYETPWRARLTAAGHSHPLCRLENNTLENARLFSMLPPFYFVHSSRDLRPSGIGLLVGDGDAVVSAVHQAGLGEVVYLGTDDFWRWREAGERHHERVWAGLVRYLTTGKRQLGQTTVTVETDRDRYTEGDQVRVMVQRSGAAKTGDAPLDVFVERVEGPGDEPGGRRGDTPPGEASPERGTSPESAPSRRWRVSLYPDLDRGAPGGDAPPDRFAGLFRVRKAGKYRVVLGTEEKTTFEAAPVSTEWQDPSPDFELLREVAARTGGSLSRLDEIAELPHRIPDGTVREIVGRRATTIWDSAVLMILFAGLLTLEWALRKLWHLN